MASVFITIFFNSARIFQTCIFHSFLLPTQWNLICLTNFGTKWKLVFSFRWTLYRVWLQYKPTFGPIIKVLISRCREWTYSWGGHHVKFTWICIFCSHFQIVFYAHLWSNAFPWIASCIWKIWIFICNKEKSNTWAIL